MEKYTYEWVRSRRKTVVIQIREDGGVVVRTPYSVSRRQVEQFLEERQAWILKNRQTMKEAQNQKTVITEEMRKAGIQKAKEIFPERVEYYAQTMGISYGRITIREQKTRWGKSELSVRNAVMSAVRAPAEIETESFFQTRVLFSRSVSTSCRVS